MDPHRVQRHAPAEPFEQRQAAGAGSDHDRVGGHHVDFVRTRRAPVGGRRRKFDRDAARIEAKRGDFRAEAELHALSVERLLDQFREQRAVAGALGLEQHAAGEAGFGRHRRFERRAGGGVQRAVRQVERAQQFERGLHRFPVARIAHHVQDAGFLLEFEFEARLEVGDRVARRVDQRAQPRVLRGERIGFAQHAELLDETANAAVEARLVDDAAVARLALAHEGRPEPDVERARQQRAAVAVGRALRDGRMAFDDAHAVAGCAQLVGGGDAADSAANDDDIHGLLR
ncbi:hypothetical protein FEP99_06601 [Burkholderia pseudomultivorans]|nr:hypothetical protein [Burkholderia pseudomultivorans]